MSEHLPMEVRAALADAANPKPGSRVRLRVVSGTRSVPVLRRWQTGFAISVREAVPCRGLVDLYDGERHLARCLIVASTSTREERHFEFKRFTQPAAGAALDFVQVRPARRKLLPGPVRRALGRRLRLAGKTGGAVGAVALF